MTTAGNWCWRPTTPASWPSCRRCWVAGGRADPPGASSTFPRRPEPHRTFIETRWPGAPCGRPGGLPAMMPMTPACASMPSAACRGRHRLLLHAVRLREERRQQRARAARAAAGPVNRRAAMVGTLVRCAAPMTRAAGGQRARRRPDHRAAGGRQRLRLRPGDVHSRVRSDLRAAEQRGQERQQSPRPCRACDVGTDARALVSGHRRVSQSVIQLHRPGQLQLSAPAAADALHPPALVPEEMPLLRLQFARVGASADSPSSATSMRCAPTSSPACR